MTLLCWLIKYEAVAVWLEGIALLAIFLFDIWVARRDHKETVEQLKLAQAQIAASHNAERAWVMAQLRAGSGEGDAPILHVNSEPLSQYKTAMQIDLVCTNEGRSPGWIDRVSGYGRLGRRGATPFSEVPLTDYGAIGPIGAGRTSELFNMIFNFTNQYSDGDVITLYVKVEYHDIFGVSRETRCCYCVIPSGMMFRETKVPKGNENS